MTGTIPALLLAAGLAMVQPTPLRILFVGNSLTYINDVPALVVAIGRANQRILQCEQVTAPDLSLEDHWRLGDARRAIARGGWDIVVLQQGPRHCRNLGRCSSTTPTASIARSSRLARRPPCTWSGPRRLAVEISLTSAARTPPPPAR